MPPAAKTTGQRMSALRPEDVTPGAATAVAAAYGVVALAVAGVLIARRDV